MTPELTEMGPGLSAILRRSCSLMAERGYHGTSIRDIARETGRSLAGLYHYFRGKEDLLFLINYHGFSTLGALARRIDDDFATPVSRLYAFVYAHTRYFVDNIDAMRVMMWGTQELTPEKAEIIRSLKENYTKHARTIVAALSSPNGDKEGAPDGGPSDATVGGDPVALERKTYLLFGMMNWVYSWYEPGRHGNVDQLAGDIFELFVRGDGGGNTTTDPVGGRGELRRINRDVRHWYEANRTTPLEETPGNGREAKQ